jgi:hypothetical protein
VRPARIAVCALAVLGALGGAPALAANVVQNGGAEDGPGGTTNDGVLAIPGWTLAGKMSPLAYGCSGCATTAEAARIGGGLNYFSGGGYVSESTATQEIVLDAVTVAAVDAQTREAVLSAQLGSYSDGDTPRITASFLGAGGALLGSVRVELVNPREPAHPTNTFVPREAAARVPPGTRTILVEIRSSRTNGDSNDGYADNVSLDLRQVAPPRTDLRIAFEASFSSPVTPARAVPNGGVVPLDPGGTLAVTAAVAGGSSPVALSCGEAVAAPPAALNLRLGGANAPATGLSPLACGPGGEPALRLSGEYENARRTGESIASAFLDLDGDGTEDAGEPAGTFRAAWRAVAPAPNLQNTIPAPQTVTAGPTQARAPGQISLRSLKRSKCVKVVVRSTRPARVLATIFSGRRSLRLFGQKEVRFFVPGQRVVCITVPRRAHTFNIRTPLRFALGYRLGTAPPRPGAPAPRPVIRPIRLVP